MEKISVILPTLNERDNIINLIDAVESALIKRDCEIIVVDDNSPDGTWQLVEERSRKDPQVQLIRRIGRTGLTSALQEGIEKSSGEIIVWMDADFSMPPEKIPELISEVEKGSGIAVGSRFVEGGKDARGTEYGIHIFLSRIICRLSSILLSPKFRDYTSGFIAIRREVLRELGLRGDYGEYFIDLIYRAILRGCYIKEVPYKLVPRVHGKSKTSASFLRFCRHGLGYIWTIIRLRFST